MGFVFHGDAMLSNIFHISPYQSGFIHDAELYRPLHLTQQPFGNGILHACRGLEQNSVTKVAERKPFKSYKSCLRQHKKKKKKVDFLLALALLLTGNTGLNVTAWPTYLACFSFWYQVTWNSTELCRLFHKDVSVMV